MLGLAAAGALIAIGIAMWLMYVAAARRRAVLDALSARHPSHWHAIADPTPGRLMRGAGPRLDRFVHEGRDRDLDDPDLSAACDALRRTERQWVAWLFVGFALFALAAWLARGE